jgi:hypothetical protein
VLADVEQPNEILTPEELAVGAPEAEVGPHGTPLA